MSKNVNHIQHVKSNVVENNQPKLPSANILAYGEIAINYADGYETISLKNSGDTVVRFSSDDYYTSQKLGSGFTGANSANTVTSVIEDNERVTATALNELNDAVADIDVELSGKTDTTAFTAHTASTSHMNATEKTNLDSLATNIAAISGITSTKVSNWDTAYTSAHSHSNKSYLDGITGNVGSMAYESTGNYYTTEQTSGSTELSTAFGNKVNNSTFTAHTASTSHMSATEKENLDSLSGNIAAISAITSTKVSNWDTAYTSAHSHSNKSVLDGISSGDITQWNKQFDDAKYELSGTTHVINFYHSGTVKATIDATDFIKDGMVDNVVISGGNLVITFNTDAGKQAITIPLTDIFNPANYYDKTAIDNKLGSGFTGANSGNTVTQVIEDNEEITAAALNTLNDAVADIDAELSGKTDNTAFTAHTASTSHMNATEKTNLDSLATNIAAISGITSTKVNNWDTAYTSAHNHANMSVISGISASDITNWNGKTDNTAFTAHTANTTVHITAAERTSWNAKADKTYVDDKLGSAFTGANSGVSVTKYVEDNELVISNALNVLNDKIKEPLVETTYANLVTLRNGSGLTPGANYRITDYVTTTTQANTQSAGHQFDLIVVADDVNKLNEDAHAIQHSGDTYFSGSNLNAWEIKYCLDNDTTRFAWADSGATGKGVIYYMKDEWNNECPYDFKNIQYKRYRIDTCNFCPNLEGLFSTDNADGITADTSTTYWSYTFCMYDLNDNQPHDVSVEQDRYPSDESFPYHQHDNVIRAFTDTIYDEESHQIFSLPNIVFITDTDITAMEYNDGIYTYGEFYGFYSNTFGANCRNNTFGNNCSNNIFGNYCNNNTFGNNCSSNIFGNYCNNNFWNNCDNNSFGNGCNNNTFRNNCSGNIFGNNCDNNSFGNNCNSNTFWNNCNNNSFGNNYERNSFGNGCNYNSFGNICYDNSFGNACNNINFQKDYIYYVIVENGNQYINVTSTQTTSDSNVLRNFTIAQGVNNTATTKTISHNTVNDTFQTIYQPANSQVISV